ncbi:MULTISPECIES: gp53-like domain-containing protein [Pseudomonadaceae]|uniref:gp53-like domain-containing protein n=1 Tax=Pseudomonadaceae TaxID=135621 RepID=UPI0005C95BFA|nr:hypothetical protein [Pseudomonas sp. FeS53a]KIV64334.1 Phage tail fiber protein [Pseudomonas sp. FeS53a]
MTQYKRPDETVFASGAKTGEVENFPDIARGWGVSFDQTNGIPPMEWFNALFKRNDEALRYLLQRGIAEWSATEDYPVSAHVQESGKVWKAKVASLGKQPSVNPSEWVETALTRDALKVLIQEQNFAPISSPALSGNPTAPTPAQFDNDSSIATTEFVQRAMGGFGRTFSYGTAGQKISSDRINSSINLYGSCTDITLPLSASVPAGSVIQISAASLLCYIKTQGVDRVYANSSNQALTGATIGDGDSVTFVSSGDNRWFMYGVGALRYASSFGSSLSSNGYQKLPSGLILQWGAGISMPDGTLPIKFPVAFPNAFFGIHGTHVGEGSATVIELASTRSNTGVTTKLFNILGETNTWFFTWFAIGN